MEAFIRYDRVRGKITDIVYQPRNAEPSGLYKLDVNGGMLILPSEIDGQPVVEIEDFIFMPYGKEGCLDSIVEKLVVPETYQRLGNRNFSGWTNLRRVYLNCPSHALCQWNFAYCELLTEVICINSEMAEKCHEASTNSIESMYGCFDAIYSHIQVTVKCGDFSSFDSFCNEICGKVKEKLIKYLGRDWIDLREFIYARSIFDYPMSPSSLVRIPIMEIELPKVRQYLQTYIDDWKNSVEHNDAQRFKDYMVDRMFHMTIESCRNIWGG